VYENGLLHPRKKFNRKIENYGCCSNMGCFGCCKSCSKSAVEDSDLGSVVYFKVLKSLLVWLFIMAIVNVALMGFYYSNNPFEKLTNYLDVFFRFSVGNLDSSNYFLILALINCNKYNASEIFGYHNFPNQGPPVRYLQNQTNANITYTFSFDCKEYQFLKIDNFGYTKIATNEILNQESCVSFSSSMNLYIDSTCQLTNWLEVHVDQCRTQKNCTIILDTTDLFSQCQYDRNDANIYLSYYCYDKYIHIGDYDVDRSSWAYVVSALDVFCMVGLLITLIIITRAQKNNKREFYEKNILINKYTIRISNLDIEQDKIYNYVDKLILHLQKLTGDVVTESNVQEQQFVRLETKRTIFEPKKVSVKEDPESLKGLKNIKQDKDETKGFDEIETLCHNNFIYEINFPNLGQHKLNLINLKTKLMKKIAGLKLKYYLTKKIGRMDKCKVIETEYKFSVDKVVAIDKEIETNTNEGVGTIHDIFITFINGKTAYNISKLYSISRASRCCYFLCCNYKKIKHLYFNRHWLNIEYCPDDPTNIKWRNMTYSKVKRCLLKSISTSLAVLIVLLGFGVIVAGKILQDDVNEGFNLNLNCDYVSYRIEEVTFELSSSIPPKAKVKTYCFCKHMLDTDGYFATGNYVLPNTSNNQPCSEWLNAYTKSIIITYGIIIVIPFINAILKIVVVYLTQMERNKTFSDDTKSNMGKLSISQYFNVAITIVLVNISVQEVKKWNNHFPIFTGNYTDMTPTWYLNIGGTITFAMILNIFVPHLMNMLFFLIAYLRRLFDSCNLVGYYSKRTIKETFSKMYLGPEFYLDIRYSLVVIFNIDHRFISHMSNLQCRNADINTNFIRYYSPSILG
jgi:hypothetical protein